MAENVVIAGATYSEVNAMTVPTSNGESVTFVDSELIPQKVSQLENDSGYLTSLGADYILEAGTKNGWKWEKWNSGKYICYGIFTDTCSHYTIVTPFYGYYSTNFPYPITFPEPPIVLFNCKIGNGFGMPAGDVMRSSSAVRCYALSTARDIVTCVWEIYVVGRWK